MFKNLILVVAAFMFATISTFSYNLCIPEICALNLPAQPLQQITYSVSQVGCGSCTYTVFFREIQCDGQSLFQIENIAASSTNLPCCQATSINDPIVSGYILREAGRLIAANGTGSSNNQYSVFLPSKCWHWVGGLGQSYSAVLETCFLGESCCEMKYQLNTNVTPNVWEWIGNYSYGVTCDPEAACFPICD